MDSVAALRKAKRWFWALTVTTILLLGVITQELAAEPGPVTGIAVAITATLMALTATQASRLMLAIGKAAPAKRRKRSK